MTDGGAVVITGTNGGLGSAMAARFAREGIAVIGIDRDPDTRGLAHFVRFDVGRLAVDGAAGVDLLTAIDPLLGGRPLVGLVNNAAVQRLGGLDELALADLTESMQVNVIAPTMLIKLLGDRLAEAGGTVVNIASIHAKLTKPRFVAYATSKAALVGMTQAVAVDQGGRIRVMAVLPAAVETDMLRAGFADDPDGLERLAAHHPTRTIGTPEQVADLCHHLVTGDHPFLHGACIDMTGGITHRLHDPS